MNKWFWTSTRLIFKVEILFSNNIVENLLDWHNQLHLLFPNKKNLYWVAVDIVGNLHYVYFAWTLFAIRNHMHERISIPNCVPAPILHIWKILRKYVYNNLRINVEHSYEFSKSMWTQPKYTNDNIFSIFKLCIITFHILSYCIHNTHKHTHAHFLDPQGFLSF